MKKLIIFLLFSFLITTPCFATENQSGKGQILDGEIIELDTKTDIPSNELDETTPLEDLSIEKEVLKTGIQKYYTFDKGILKLHPHEKINFDFGAIGLMNWQLNSDDDYDLHSKYKFSSVDFVLSGQLNDYFDYKAQMFAERNINEETILGDLWLRGKWKNYVAQIGRMRKPFAYEPTFSSYDLDFATRSQVGRLFGDHRDSGGKIIGNYKYADVAMGLYASMQDRPFWFGKHGIEFDSWLVLKPLANFPEKGELKIAGGIAVGDRDYSYDNYAAFASYKYKKFGLKTEYIYKEAAFYDEEKEASGFYIDGTYFLTDKLQAAIRFDSFDKDNQSHTRRTNEYVAGLNYFINKKNTMLTLNYIFADENVNSHRVALQMRYRTW